MNEEIQKQIAEALKGLREGAPEIWQELCREVVARGIWGGISALLFSLMGCAVLFFTLRVGIRRIDRDEEEFGFWAFVWGVAGILTVFGLLVASQKFISCSAPSLTLLEKLK